MEVHIALLGWRKEKDEEFAKTPFQMEFPADVLPAKGDHISTNLLNDDEAFIKYIEAMTIKGTTLVPNSRLIVEAREWRKTVTGKIVPVLFLGIWK